MTPAETRRSGLRIEDRGDHREVLLAGPAFYDGTWHGAGVGFRTVYRPDTLEAMHAVKGAYLYDEILRIEDATYLRDQFLELLLRHAPLAGCRVLDFGSGCGSSSILLAREGASVRSVELMEGPRRVARLRVRDEGLAERIEIVEAGSMTDLPFAPASFDVVSLNAVVEHVRPEERAPILRHLWTLLAPGGLLVITETPNRLWLWDGHTTRLPFIPWMPRTLACRVARLARPGELGRKSDEDLVYDGIVGATWWSLRSWLPAGARPIGDSPAREHAAYFARLRRRKRGSARVLVDLIALGFLPLSFALSLGRSTTPLSAFFPYLNLAYRKTE
jgi:2-polyprenyl-3-methyl-5-hydroxy-6-metoxy-1,4-benzoquinol methylase